MAHFLELLIEDKPCHKCVSCNDCRTANCIRWRNWFSVVWHELQKLYLHQN